MKKQSLYSEKLEKGNRKFYLDVRETEKGSNFLSVSEITTKENEEDQRRQIVIFESEIDQFAAALVRTLLQFNVSEQPQAKPEARIARINEAKATYARAYEPWDKKEDAELALLFSQGKTMTEIGESLQRNPGAINIRIEKLGLVKTLAA
jgi:PurA ssDNA and RNA-binding protein